VVLKLWVRVTPDWRESVPRLEELGYTKGRGNRASEEGGEYVIVATLDDAAEGAEGAGDELDGEGEDETDGDDDDEAEEDGLDDEDEDGAEGDGDLDDGEEQPDEDGEEQS
jgi:hypothetical protein